MGRADSIEALRAEFVARLAEFEIRLAEQDKLIRKQAVRIEKLEARNRELETQNRELETRNRELEARLKQSSRNSSKPPSSDPLWMAPKGDKSARDKKRNKKKQEKRKRGAQPGHEKHSRPLVPTESVDKVKRVRPTQCGSCSAALKGSDPQPRRHQVWDLPEIKPNIIEYQLEGLDCRCGERTYAELPRGVPRGNFGPTLMALVCLLTGKFRLSKRSAQELCSDLLATPVSLGAVSNMEKTVSRGLAEPVQQARAYVQECDVAHLDETGWREANNKAWLWVAVTTVVTVFEVVRCRGAEVAKRLLGVNWNGVLVSDRWSAYLWVDKKRRQLCWAHLIRDFTGFVDRSGPGSGIGRQLLKQTEQMFEWWHRVRDGTLTRKSFRIKMRPLRRETRRLLQAGAKCKGRKTAGMCKEMLKLEPALWTFVDVDDVEPTNNTAERQIRPAVLWRKSSFGTQSKRGSQFVERILTVVATLKQQNRHVLSFLTEACKAQLSGEPAPSLLPSTHHKQL